MAKVSLVVADLIDGLRLPYLSGTWSLVIWLGLVVLTISLLILTRTRWGQSKPISKCIALSVFAHLLMMIYAYCTHLWTAPPTLAVYDTFQIRIVSESESQGEPDVSPEQLLAESDAVSAASTLQPKPAGEEFLPTETDSTPVKASITDDSQPAPELDTPPTFDPPEPAEPMPEPPTPPLPLEPPAASDLTELPVEQSPADLLAVPETVTSVTDAGDEVAVDSLAAEIVENPRLQPVPETPVTAPSYQRPALYQYRSQAQRQQSLQKFGGNARSEAAVHAALQWLVNHQGDNGGWSPRALEGGVERRIGGHDRKGAGGQADTGISGLVLLAFLGNGQTQWEGVHRQVVKKGLEYLTRQQAQDGNLAGSARLFARMYCHGMATLALSEAYAMTGDARLAAPVQRAARYTMWAQHPRSGGWRYQSGDRGDMSQFGWQVMALRSAQCAGVEWSATTRQLNTRFLRSVLHGKAGGLASYRPLQQPSRTMTAEAMVCRAFLNWPRNEAAIQEGVQYILRELPGSGKKNFYYWYYASLALHQIQGPAWPRWNQALQTELLRLQRREDPWEGSWDPDTVWGAYGGRAYSTAMAALCLEVYYRYLPLYQQQ
ncbi:MAG: prenyltransferase/squalene oxidase repeat-containing protein [Pirellulaceae bacterium]